MTRQAVILIHGVGEQSSGYSLECQRKIDQQLLKFLQDEGFETDDTGVIYSEVLWAPLTSKHQSTLWGRVNKGVDLDLVKLRKFFVAFGGDAIAYQRTREGQPIYDAIHAQVQGEIDKIRNKFPSEKIEFTFLAHSLGSVIISNFLYDERERITATNLFSVGSPIVIWLLRYGDPRQADAPILVQRPHGVWINILDDEDVIAYPLREINTAYKKAVDWDYVTEIGGIFSVGNPMSHIGYWDDGNVVKPVAKKLALDYKRLETGARFKKRKYINFIKSLWNI